MQLVSNKRIIMRTHVLIIIWLQFCLCQCTESSNNLEESSETVDVICKLNTTLEENMPSYLQAMSVKTLNLEFCPPPALSLAHTLAQHNISSSAIRKLILRIKGNRLLTRSEIEALFRGLTIEELSVESFHQRQVFSSDALDPRGSLHLQSLKVLDLTSFILPPLPATLGFRKITLEFGRSLASFGECRYLEVLVLRNWAVPRTSAKWLAECKELRSLTIEYSTPEIVERLLDGISNITDLAINNCGLYILPMGIEKSVYLEKLDLSHNNIVYIEKPDFFTNFKGLKELILDNNQLTNCDGVRRKPVLLPDLVYLSVADNQMFDVCNINCYDYGATKMQSTFWNMPSLKRVNAAYGSTFHLCFGNSTLDSLEHLNFTKNEITYLQFKDLPLKTATNLQMIDFRDNHIGGLSLEKEEYENLPNDMTILGVNITVECDCQNAWLASAMRNKRLAIGVQCSDHTILTDTPVDQLQCDRFQCDACICRRAWRDNVTVARCDGRLRALPRLEGVREIHAPGNLIAAIGVTELPQSLAFLDLSSNHISRISASEAAALFAGGARTVRLAGNPFVCDCAALPLLHALRTHHTQVDDYDEITCSDDQRNVSQVDLDELCAAPLREMWLIGGPIIGAVILAGVLTAVYFGYKREIKMFLFVHGYCLWCVREDDIDSDRPYDAFVSFSHLDDEFVSEHLLPGLEAERRYRLCVHYRDWVVGEWISTQISQSVDLSRRVIIVLSKNFLASSWALLEFRLAQMRSLKEGRSITIVVIIDDVLEDPNLNAEIRGYLAMTTYVKWGDPWFWKKIELSLPQKVPHGPGVEIERVG